MPNTYGFVEKNKKVVDTQKEENDSTQHSGLHQSKFICKQIPLKQN